MRRNNAIRIKEFADDLRNFVDSPGPLAQFGIEEKNEKIDKICRDVVLAADLLADLAKEVEFFVQGDINRETFLERYKEIESKYETKLA